MSWNFNPMAGPWLAAHIWEYYGYTRDLNFLKETGYELIKSSADFEVDMTVSHRTVVISHGHPVVDTYTGGGSATPVDHNHPIKGRKKFKVHNALVVGDWVVLARMQKGKKFVVLDRIKANPALKGEWL